MPLASFDRCPNCGLTRTFYLNARDETVSDIEFAFLSDTAKRMMVAYCAKCSRRRDVQPSDRSTL